MIASEIKMQAQTDAGRVTQAGGARRRAVIFFAVAAVLLLALVVLSVSVGSTHVSAVFVARVLLAHALPSGWLDLSEINQAQQAIIWQLRAPRVVVAALVGASLAVAGTLMQGLFRNPLASPDVVGTSAGGALGAVVAIASGAAMRSVLALPLFSFVGSLVALLAVYLIATRRGRTPIATLLLAGVALSALFSAANSFLISVTWVRWEVAQEITFWLMGGLDNRHWMHCLILLPCAAAGLGVALGYGRELDLLLLGEETALALGVEVERTRRILLVNAALLTGAAVAVSGVVGFVGLISPHLARLLIGPSHRRLLPASVFTGAIFLLAADLVARTIIRPEEVRLGIVTAGLGAPFFLLLLLRHQRAANY
jgi:iron complex transport system permease protein